MTDQQEKLSEMLRLVETIDQQMQQFIKNNPEFDLAQFNCPAEFKGPQEQYASNLALQYNFILNSLFYVAFRAQGFQPSSMELLQEKLDLLPIELQNRGIQQNTSVIDQIQKIKAYFGKTTKAFSE